MTATTAGIDPGRKGEEGILTAGDSIGVTRSTRFHGGAAQCAALIAPYGESAPGHFETRTSCRAALRSPSLAPPLADRRSGAVSLIHTSDGATKARGGAALAAAKHLRR